VTIKAYAMDVHKGRISRTLFPKQDSKTERVLELIHSDVCGPMPSSSINGYVYYVSFINDYSRKRPGYILSVQQDQRIQSLDKRTLLQKRLRYLGQIMEENIPQKNS
jgi:hypothetical protein